MELCDKMGGTKVENDGRMILRLRICVRKSCFAERTLNKLEQQEENVRNQEGKIA